jgi:hypothetical protein
VVRREHDLAAVVADVGLDVVARAVELADGGRRAEPLALGLLADEEIAGDARRAPGEEELRAVADLDVGRALLVE